MPVAIPLLAVVKSLTKDTPGHLLAVDVGGMVANPGLFI